MNPDLVPAVIGYVLFLLFVGFLAVKVGAAPLIVIVAAVLILAGIAFRRELSG